MVNEDSPRGASEEHPQFDGYVLDMWTDAVNESGTRYDARVVDEADRLLVIYDSLFESEFDSHDNLVAELEANLEEAGWLPSDKAVRYNAL